MKQSPKNEAGLLDLLNKIQLQLSTLEKKVDTLIDRSVPAAKAPSQPSATTTKLDVRTADHDRNKSRLMYDAVCADCQKACSIPFKPSGDRPVYCKDCFSRRKMISLSKTSVPEKPKETPSAPAAPIKAMDLPKAPAKKKKASVTKKTVVKKKATPKKK